MKTFATVVAMKLANLTVGQLVSTKGYTAEGDGGQATYYIKAPQTFDGKGDHEIANSNIAVLQRGAGLNVATFGAKGDGSTDDSASINAAIAEASSGDRILFPAPSSSYYIASPISVNKRVSLVGGGCEVTSTTAMTMFDMTVESASLDGFKLTGNRTSNQIAVRVGQNFMKVRNLDITLVDMGVEVWAGVWQRLEHIRSRNIVTTVLRVGNVVGTVVEDFRYDTDTGTYAEPATGIDLFGEGCNFSDLDFIHSGTCLKVRTNARSSTWNFFNSCSFDTSTYGLHVVNTDAAESVKGLMFDHCWFSSHSENGVYLNGNFNTDGISFKGCYFVNNDKIAMLVDEASTNVELDGCTFAGSSVSAPNTYPHIRHDSIGDVSVLTTSFHDWGGLTTVASSAIDRTVGGAFIIIGDCNSNASYNTAGFTDASASPSELGTNFGNLPSSGSGAVVLNDLTDVNSASPSDGEVLSWNNATSKWIPAGTTSGLPNSTTETSGNLNITSTDATFNTIRGEATVQSGVEGTSSSATAYGGVFSNTGGGAGLRVASGGTQLAGALQVDTTLSVSGASTLTGTVSGTGFNSSVDARVALAAHLPDSTTETTGNLNITSSSGTFNTIRGESVSKSGVEGTTNSASNYGGVFSNTGGGAGLRVSQGNAQFASSISVDTNLAVSGTSTLTGSVAGTGFVNSVDARVSYETLNNKSDVGTGSTQVSRGNHTHTTASITDIAKFKARGDNITTNASGVGTITHGFGATPATFLINTLGDATITVQPTSTGATTMTFTARDLATHALKANSTINVQWFISA